MFSTHTGWGRLSVSKSKRLFLRNKQAYFDDLRITRKPMRCHFIVPNSFPLALAVILFRLFVFSPKMRTKIGQKLKIGGKLLKPTAWGATFHAGFKNDVSFPIKLNFDLDFGY